MFDSITHWFDSLQQQSRLFDHADDEILHSALASVLYHIISADHHLDARKKREFRRMMKQEFSIDDDQVEHLYQAAKGSASDIHSDLHTIHFYLKRNPAVRMTFMRKLLQLIDVEGVQPAQLDIFYEALHEVFPEVRELGSEADL
jgi:uncharacterized tellurite resistance protein B-like protein